MIKNHKKEFKKAFLVSVPVMMGYLVLGFAFGLLLVSSGYDWYLAPLMSIFIYAGALQFIAIGFFNVPKIDEKFCTPIFFKFSQKLSQTLTYNLACQKF